MNVHLVSKHASTYFHGRGQGWACGGMIGWRDHRCTRWYIAIIPSFWTHGIAPCSRLTIRVTAIIGFETAARIVFRSTSMTMRRLWIPRLAFNAPLSDRYSTTIISLFDFVATTSTWHGSWTRGSFCWLVCGIRSWWWRWGCSRI